jgi:2-octaprenyl-6-methoxyphenol hydroxylase
MMRHSLVILGGGTVGAAFALAASRAGLSCALVEAREPPACPGGWQGRWLAISPASQAFLDQLGVWPRLATDRLAPMWRMAVSDVAAGASFNLDAYRAGEDRLATLVDLAALDHALWQAIQASPRLTVYRARAAGFRIAGARREVVLEDGRVLAGELLVGADGAHSALRQAAGLEARRRAYGQQGVIANFACEKPHRGTAFQWFRDDGVLAWLPLPGARFSLVWSTPDEHAGALLALDAEAFAETVSQAGAGCLGRLQSLSPAQAFPLALTRVTQPVAPGVVLIGDAAHTLHPLAGQGVNLGLGDAAALAGVLAGRGLADCGDIALLARYRRRRAAPVAGMQAITDGLQQIFSRPDAFSTRLRHLGLAAFDRAGPLKAALVRRTVRHF